MHGWYGKETKVALTTVTKRQKKKYIKHLCTAASRDHVT